MKTLTMETFICHQCGHTVLEGNLCQNYHIMTEGDIEHFAKFICNGCGTKVSLEITRKQGLSNWHNVPNTDSNYCPGCSHNLQLNIKKV